ncbi:hypothetical protein RUM43_012662 [Polyplax serrata]|uniref:Uncharacterized protein n=1 Tax=Polyplax serrata TaxID=468196 RepID=A0AAN8PIC5_POLSC
MAVIRFYSVVTLTAVFQHFGSTLTIDNKMESVNVVYVCSLAAGNDISRQRDVVVAQKQYGTKTQTRAE